MLWSSSQGRGLSVELHRNRREAVRRVSVKPHITDEPVRHDLWIVEELGNRLNGRPRRVEAGEEVLPLGEGSLGELLIERSNTCGPVLPTHLEAREPWIVGQVLAPHESAKVGPV